MNPASQRMNALALANVVRVENSRTVRDIAALSYVDGIDRVIALLEGGDVRGPFGSIPIYRLLKSPAYMGEAKVRVLLKAAGVVSGDRRVRQLTIRQRVVLVECLRDPERLWPETGIPRLRRERGVAA